MDDEDTRDLEAYLDGHELTAGQRRRLALFQAVENGVAARIEALCEKTNLPVVDVAVLIVAPEAHGAFFGAEPEPGTAVILGERTRIYRFLDIVLPAAAGTPFDPYVDLLESAPPQCVRVVIIDDQSLTVLSYGSFVTVELDPKRMARA